MNWKGVLRGEGTFFSVTGHPLRLPAPGPACSPPPPSPAGGLSTPTLWPMWPCLGRLCCPSPAHPGLRAGVCPVPLASPVVIFGIWLFWGWPREGQGLLV